jgi:alanine dehydrogenase
MSKQNLLFLSKNDIKDVITMKEVIELMKDAFRQVSSGKITAPLRTPITIPKHDAVALFMPAHSVENDLISLKLVSVFKNNPSINLPLIHALVVLMDGKNGQPLAIMDGEYLTALRTGAASGLASDLLARVDSQVLGIFGAGVQGRTQLEAVCEVRNINKVMIFDKNPEAAKSLEEGVQGDFEISINPSQNSLAQCDIICTATSSSHPVFSNDDLKEGVHINAIGAYQADKREIPSETIKQARLVVDQRAACLEEAGDIVIPLNEKIINEDHITAELGEIVTGDNPGRRDNTEITVFKSVGNAAQDLLTAGAVFKKAQERDIGVSIQF